MDFDSFDANFDNFNANQSLDYNIDLYNTMDKVLIWDGRSYIFTHKVFDEEFISNLYKLAIKPEEVEA